MPDAVRAFLEEFGGLTIGQVRIDPYLACWDRAIFHVFGEWAGVPLYPIGLAAGPNRYLGISANGVIHGGLDDVRPLAEHPDAALASLIAPGG